MDVAFKVGFKLVSCSQRIVLILVSHRAVTCVFNLSFNKWIPLDVSQGMCNSLKTIPSKGYCVVDGNCFSLLTLTNHIAAIQRVPDTHGSGAENLWIK